MASADDEAVTPSAPLPDGLATLLEAVTTRLELAATELAEQRLHLARQAMYFGLMLFCGVLAALLAIAWLVFVAPEAQRALVLGAITALSAGIAAACGWRAHVLAQRRAPLLQSTLDVLRADAAALRSQRRA